MPEPAHDGTAAANRGSSDAPGCTGFTAEVTAVRELARSHGRQVWQIALNRTEFDPGTGKTRGVLTAQARSGRTIDLVVSAVEKDALGETWHVTDKPLQEGTAVRACVSLSPPDDTAV